MNVPVKFGFAEMEDWKGEVASGEDEVSFIIQEMSDLFVWVILFCHCFHHQLHSSPFLLIITISSTLIRLWCPSTMWREFCPEWFPTSKALSVSSTGEKVSPSFLHPSREEIRTERDELITKQEMELALGVMKSQIVEEIRWESLRYFFCIYPIYATGWFFFTGSALKVLSVGDGKIPTKKVKVWVKTSYFLCEIPLLSLFW